MVFLHVVEHALLPVNLLEDVDVDVELRNCKTLGNLAQGVMLRTRLRSVYSEGARRERAGLIWNM